MPGSLAALDCRLVSLARERFPRSRLMTFSLQGSTGGARTSGRGFALGLTLPLAGVPDSLLPRLARSFSLSGGWQFHSSPASLGKADRDSLFRGSGAMLALANVVHLLSDEFTRLRARGFALAGVFMSALKSLFFRHTLLHH